MKFIRKNNAGLMFKWLVSYLLVFIIPVVAGYGIYLSAANIIRGDINAVSDYVLKQIQLSFDNITNEVYALSRQIALDSELGKLMDKKEFTADDSLVLKDFVTKCSIYKATATSVDDYYIYLKNSGSIIRYSGFIDRASVADFIPDDGRFGMEQWEEIISGAKSNKIISYAYKTDTVNIYDAVSYVIPIPLYGGEPKGFVVANVKKDRYRDIAFKINEKSDFAVMDGNDGLIFSTLDKEADAGLLDGLSGQIENGELKYGGKKYHIRETYSGVNSLRYISITQKNLAYEKLSYVKKIMTVTLGLCIFAGIACAVYFSRKRYKPVKVVLNLLLKQKLLKNSADYEEDKVLLDAITQLISDKNKIDSKLYRQQDYVRTSILSKLVNQGFDSGGSAQKIQQMCELDLSKEYFSVLGFYAYEQQEGQDGGEEYELLFLIIKNIFEELLNQCYTAYIAEINGTICAIVNFHETEKLDYKETVGKIIDCGMKAVLNNFGLELAVGSSMVRKGLSSIPKCYSEMVTSIQNLVFRQSKDLLFYEELITEETGSYEYYFSFNREQQLIDCIRSGDADGAKAIIGNVFEKYHAQSTAPADIFRCVVSDIAAAVYKAECQVQGMKASELPRVWQAQNFDAAEIKKEFFASIDAICEQIQDSMHENENQLVKNIKELIAMEYNNINLNISHIANELELNSTYISRVFAANTGDGLLNYINKYRVEKAKELLRNPDLVIETIAAMTGFNNSNSFIRVFKKYELKTPGQYRHMILEKEDF